MAINWQEAPEGTTHAADWGKGPRWRKVTDRTVFIWHNEWEDMECDPEAWLIEYADVITAKPLAPPVVVINGVEVNWAEAPADATHAMIDKVAIRSYGQWRRVDNEKVCNWVGGEWVIRSARPKVWLDANRGLYIERDPAAIKQEVEAEPKPAPKKPIGWWS